MQITLSPHQAALWDGDPWSSYRVEEDLLEQVERQHITEPVAVLLPDGRTAFAITPQRRRRERARRNHR